MACSALKKSYRDYLRDRIAGEVAFVHLRGDFDLITRRLEARGGHFMAAELLHSQFEELEPPTAVVVDVEDPVEQLVERILNGLERLSPTQR